MKILIDKREQMPYFFRGFEGVIPEITLLHCGDYSLPGFEDKIAIERKALPDLIACLMGDNRIRFEKELARARHFEYFAVVIEASLADVSKGYYRSEMKPQAALQSILTFGIRYPHAHFIWCGSRLAGEYVVHGLLSKFLREIGERYKAATKRQADAA